MPRWRSHTARASAARSRVGFDVARVDQEEIVAEGVRLDERKRVHLRQNASRCHPKRRTSERGSALNVPTKKVLYSSALPAAVQPRLHRETAPRRSGPRGSPQQRAELRGAVFAEHGRVFVLERHLHQLRQRVQPRHAVVDLEDGLAARLQHAAALVDQRPGVAACTARRRARNTRSNSPSANGRCSPSASRRSAWSPCCAKFCRASAMADAARSTPVTTAPPLAKRTRSVPAPQPTSSTRPAAVPVEVDEPQQMVQLLEVILVEVGEEPGDPTGCDVISRS